MPKKNQSGTVETKGYLKKIQTFKKDDKKPFTLDEIKQKCKTFDEYAKKHDGKYILRARNEYRDNLTIKSYDGSFYDEDQDYYNARGYDPEKFEKFYMFQIIYLKPKTPQHHF